jgi:ABC-type glycerol-3-phosphate transport system permease component
MVPFVTYLLPLFNTLLRIQQWTGIPMINTYWGMILPWVVFPFGVFLMRQAMFSIPSDLLDAARMDGATEFDIYWRIVVPLVRTSIAALAIIVFIFKYDDLLWPLVVAQRIEMYPITVGLVEFVGQFFVEYHLFTTAAVLAIIPIFVIYLILQRYIIEGIATQGLKG